MRGNTNILAKIAFVKILWLLTVKEMNAVTGLILKHVMVDQ
jgi:hypothetical protein